MHDFQCLKLYWQNKKNCQGGKKKKTSFTRWSFWFLFQESVVCEPKESCLRADSLGNQTLKSQFS